MYLMAPSLKSIRLMAPPLISEPVRLHDPFKDLISFDRHSFVKFLCYFSATQEQLDLGFIVGAQGSNPVNVINAQLDFISDMLQRYEISRKATLIGAIMNQEQPSIAIKLGDALTRDFFVRSLRAIQNENTGFDLNKALQIARTNLFSTDNGARFDVPKSLVVFVNGKTDGDPSGLAMQAKALQQVGIKIILIGLKDDSDPNVFEDIVDVFFFPEDLTSLTVLLRPIIQSTLPGEA